MDLLFNRYASPMELVSLYIENGRFGEFVENVIRMDNERKKKEAEKENEQKWWDMYLQSATELSFVDWKKETINKNNQQAESNTLEMTDQQVEDAKQKARGILKGFSPN